jgi:hypothetical protein
MPAYRFFRLNADNRITKPAAIAELADDGEALRHGETLADGHAVEVWDRGRRVGTISAG